MTVSSCLRGGAALGICLLTIGAGARRADAQEGQGIYVAQASARLTRRINTGNRDGFTLQNNSFSIGGGWIKQSKSDWVALFTVQLVADKNYRFLATGDDDARDVDIDIQDANGKTVAADVETSADASVDFTPRASGRYLVRIRLYDSRTNVPCVCLGVVMAKN
jgi:hypothetical protein